MEQYIGEIRMFAGSFPPLGWAFCDGQLLAIAENDALFALIGTTYGGDGVTTFALPDLRGRLPVSQGQNPQTQTTYTIGGQGGTETVGLTVQQLPAHTHAVNVSSLPGAIDSPSGSFFAENVQAFSTSPPNGTMASGTILPTGGSQPHDNMMPFLPISFIISLVGVYPTQN